MPDAHSLSFLHSAPLGRPDKFVDDDSAPAAAPAKPDESADKLAALSEDVNTIKEQLGELTELKAKMDSLIDVISQTYKLNA